jgi:hypothetical protein|eukprot:7368492-Prymnesium_polylepis.2
MAAKAAAEVAAGVPMETVPVGRKTPVGRTGAWTSVKSGEKVLLELSSLQRGFCYLLHLNETDQLSVVFPFMLDLNNEVPHPNGVLRVPSRFREGVQYLSFSTKEHGKERETFYLLSTSKRLETLIGIEELAPRTGRSYPRCQGGLYKAVRGHARWGCGLCDSFTYCAIVFKSRSTGTAGTWDSYTKI